MVFREIVVHASKPMLRVGAGLTAAENARCLLKCRPKSAYQTCLGQQATLSSQLHFAIAAVQCRILSVLYS